MYKNFNPCNFVRVGGKNNRRESGGSRKEGNVALEEILKNTVTLSRVNFAALRFISSVTWAEGKKVSSC